MAPVLVFDPALRQKLLDGWHQYAGQSRRSESLVYEGDWTANEIGRFLLRSRVEGPLVAGSKTYDREIYHALWEYSSIFHWKLFIAAGYMSPADQRELYIACPDAFLLIHGRDCPAVAVYQAVEHLLGAAFSGVYLLDGKRPPELLKNYDPRHPACPRYGFRRPVRK